MPFNRSPLREISQEDIDTYAREGAVCLRRVFDPDWIESLKPAAERILIEKEDVGLLPNNPGRYMSRLLPEYRRFAFEGPAAEAAGRVMQSSTVRFFFDEFFAKRPHSDERTIWHTDRMGWPVSGTMVPSLWIPLTPIVEENSLEVVAGTQHDDVKYWLFSPNARKMIKPEDRVPHPDGEKLRNDPAYADRFRRWQMDPGDMLIVHPWALHYSHGNPTDGWRIAISIRVLGDDIRWAPRPDCLNIAGVSYDEMIEGEAPAGPLFPLVWSQSGERDGDELYPRGFATRWSAKRREDVNDYATFNRLSRELAE